MKKDMPLEGLRWSRDSGSALYDTPQNGRSRTGWGGWSLRSLVIKVIKLFRKWFKYGLKAQKLLAQGIALGIIAVCKTPCKGKSFMFYLAF